MKYLKKFEVVRGEPQLGDYIVIEKSYVSKELHNFLTHNTGKITKKNGKIIQITYNNIPKEFEQEIDEWYVFSKNDSTIVITTSADIRYATEEEIKKYILDAEVNNYNL